MRRLFLLASLMVAACGPTTPMNGPTINNKMNPEEPASRVVSQDILRREPVTNRARVKHILIGWRDLEEAYGGHMDARAAARSKRDAEAQVEELLAQLKGGADFDTLMNAHSEDSGLSVKPDGYEVTPDAQLVLEFRRLGLRLEVGEVGVVQSDFGFHVMKREE
jgi:hypothetical protein